MKNKTVFILFALLFIGISCKTKKSDALNAIAEMDVMQKNAHYTGNAITLSELMADSFFVARSGNISWSTPMQTRTQFQAYFSKIRYATWENINPPIIQLSEDEKMATVTYHKKTVAFVKDSLGNEKVYKANFAWVSILKKDKNQWKTTGIVTTDDQ